MNNQVVVLDLDGTLLNSNKQISERNYQAVLGCWKKGAQIIFATARPPRAVSRFLSADLLNIGSFIYYNGALIDCKHTGITHHEPISTGVTAEVLDFCLGRCPDLDLSLEVQDEWLSFKEYDEETVMKVTGRPSVITLEELKAVAATKILFTGNLAVNELRDRFADQLNILQTDGGGLVQISSRQASKETAVRMLCDALGVPMSGVMVFGDDHNDLGLFQSCGWPVAMGNAVQELKVVAKEVTDTNDNDGVAKVLERLL